MDKIYDVLLEAEAIVLGSPVYFWSVSAQMKTFLDRLFPFGDFQKTSWARALEGIPFGVVLVYADKDPLTSGAGLAYEQIKVVINSVGGTSASFLHYCANDIGDISSNKQALQEAEQAGALLYEQGCNSSSG
jgi:putative NADPH-quinone reductase